MADIGHFVRIADFLFTLSSLPAQQFLLRPQTQSNRKEDWISRDVTVGPLLESGISILAEGASTRLHGSNEPVNFGFDGIRTIYMKMYSIGCSPFSHPNYRNGRYLEYLQRY